MPYWRLFYHVVWATHRRDPLLMGEVESFVHRILAVKCHELGGQAFAINGTADHVHLVGIVPPKLALAEFIGRLKGSSSRYTGLEFHLPFAWQEGYGVFTISERGLPRAIDYVRCQKEHHRAGTISARLERFSDADDGPLIAPPFPPP